jgi:hypothetical protein
MNDMHTILLTIATTLATITGGLLLVILATPIVESFLTIDGASVTGDAATIATSIITAATILTATKNIDYKQNN